MVFVTDGSRTAYPEAQPDEGVTQPTKRSAPRVGAFQRKRSGVHNAVAQRPLRAHITGDRCRWLLMHGRVHAVMGAAGPVSRVPA